MEASRNAALVGRVAGLWRYPVKSMGPEELEDVEVYWHGLVGDRRWAFVRDEAVRSGFPWLTLRQRGELQRYQPSFSEPSKPDASPTVVRTPSGDTFDVADPALAAELAPDGARVIKQDRGVFDAFPLSLVTTGSLAGLSELVGTPIEAQRFRPNVLVETSGDEAFPEDGWLSSVLHLGGVSMRVDKRDGRCVVVTMDPDTGERNPDVLRAVARERDGCLGVYGSVVTPGRVAVGDPVLLEPAPPENRS